MRGAVITGDYRYLLWREWDSNNKTVSFIMLNPNRADASFNDPTITRCINFARSWGYGRLEVVNLFAYRTPKPSLLKQATERTSHGAELNSASVSSPIGRDNDAFGQAESSTCFATANRFILESVSKSDAYGYAESSTCFATANRVILAWGNHGIWRKQDIYTLELLKNHNHLYSLGITKRGCPRHPLYLTKTIKPQLFS